MMRTNSNPHFSIIYLPPVNKLDPSYLYPNGMLLPDHEIEKLEREFQKPNDGARKLSQYCLNVSVINIPKEGIFAVYPKEVLGKGAFGEAQLAQNLKTSKYIVVKTQVPEFGVTENQDKSKTIDLDTTQVIDDHTPTGTVAITNQTPSATVKAKDNSSISPVEIIDHNLSDTIKISETSPSSTIKNSTPSSSVVITDKSPTSTLANNPKATVFKSVAKGQAPQLNMQLWMQKDFNLKEIVMGEERILQELGKLIGNFERDKINENNEKIKQTLILMEYEEGKGFENFLEANKKDGISMSDALKILINLFEAYEKLRKNNIYHRDIKPENIIIDPDLLLSKFIDFGTSIQREDDAHKDSEVVGSPSYMHPTMLAALVVAQPDFARCVIKDMPDVVKLLLEDKKTGREHMLAFAEGMFKYEVDDETKKLKDINDNHNIDIFIDDLAKFIKSDLAKIMATLPQDIALDFAIKIVNALNRNRSDSLIISPLNGKLQQLEDLLQKIHPAFQQAVASYHPDKVDLDPDQISTKDQKKIEITYNEHTEMYSFMKIVQEVLAITKTSSPSDVGIKEDILNFFKPCFSLDVNAGPNLEQIKKYFQSNLFKPYKFIKDYPDTVAVIPFTELVTYSNKEIDSIINELAHYKEVIFVTDQSIKYDLDSINLIRSRLKNAKVSMREYVVQNELQVKIANDNDSQSTKGNEFAIQFLKTNEPGTKFSYVTPEQLKSKAEHRNPVSLAPMISPLVMVGQTNYYTGGYSQTILQDYRKFDLPILIIHDAGSQPLAYHAGDCITLANNKLGKYNDKTHENASILPKINVCEYDKLIESSYSGGIVLILEFDHLKIKDHVANLKKYAKNLGDTPILFVFYANEKNIDAKSNPDASECDYYLKIISQLIPELSKNPWLRYVTFETKIKPITQEMMQYILPKFLENHLDKETEAKIVFDEIAAKLKETKINMENKNTKLSKKGKKAFEDQEIIIKDAQSGFITCSEALKALRNNSEKRFMEIENIKIKESQKEQKKKEKKEKKVNKNISKLTSKISPPKISSVSIFKEDKFSGHERQYHEIVIARTDPNKPVRVANPESFKYSIISSKLK